jgi:ribosomal protein L32E
MKIFTTHGQIGVIWSTIALSTMLRVKLAISSSATEFIRNAKNIHQRVRFWRRSSAQKSEARATW